MNCLFSQQQKQRATPAAAPASSGNEWALAPVQAQPNNQWAQAPPPPPAYGMSPQPPTQQPTYDQNQYGGAPSFAAPPSNPFAPAPIQAQPVVQTQPVQQNFAAPAPMPSSDPFGAPAFAQPAPAYNQPAPAPVADAFNPEPPAPPAAMPGTPQQQPPPAAAPTANGVNLTMGSLTSDSLLAGSTTAQPDSSTTMADKALQNLMGSIDSFGITGGAAKPPAAANNPFDSSNIMSNATLGEIKSSKSTAKKSVMNTPPNPGPGAMVMAGGQQGGNWGGYGQQAPPQYAMSGGYSQQQPQMGMGMQQQPQMGQMGMQQQPQMGMMQGQQPPMNQGYGAPQYGQQPPMQQNQWGAPSY